MENSKVTEALSKLKAMKKDNAATAEDLAPKAVETIIDDTAERDVDLCAGPSTVFVYDTETSGLPEWKIPSDDPKQPHIVQLSGLVADLRTGEILDQMDVIVKPDGWVITQETIDAHGITNERAEAEGIPEKEAIEMLINMRGDHKRVAYNKTFDQRIIRIGLKRFFPEDVMEKWHVKEDHDCAMRMAKADMKVKSVKLVDAYEHYTGSKLEGNHNAAVDTMACLDVYTAILKKQNIIT